MHYIGYTCTCIFMYNVHVHVYTCTHTIFMCIDHVLYVLYALYVHVHVHVFALVMCVLCRSDYQKISQKLRDRKHPPPLPANVPPDSRPSLTGVLPFRERSDTIARPPLSPAMPAGQSFDVRLQVYIHL